MTTEKNQGAKEKVQEKSTDNVANELTPEQLEEQRKYQGMMNETRKLQIENDYAEETVRGMELTIKKARLFEKHQQAFQKLLNIQYQATQQMLKEQEKQKEAENKPKVKPVITDEKK